MDFSAPDRRPSMNNGYWTEAHKSWTLTPDLLACSALGHQGLGTGIPLRASWLVSERPVRRNSRGDVPFMRLNRRLKCDISRKPAANAISAMVLFGWTSKLRVQAAMRRSLTCSPTERPVDANSLWM
jgi:hypothetical protein